MANAQTYDERLEQVKNTKYEVNRNDERLTQVNEAKGDKLSEVTETYNGLIAQNPYEDMIEATEKWKETQTDIQNQQTEFNIQQIEQQREQAQKDYTKEQAGAYVDWRKQSNQYGTEAEKMASAGLANTGFSESSQVSMYNTYQNRVATARESLNQAMLNYDNAINEARLQNNAAIAEIAIEAFQKQAEYALQGALRTEQLQLALMDKKMEVEKFYSDEWWKQYEYLNQEVQRDWQTEQNELELLWKEEESAKDRAHDKEMAKIENDYALERDRINNEFAEKLEGVKHDYNIKYLNAKTEKDKEVADHEYELAMQKLEQEHKNDLAKLDRQLANEKELLSHQQSLNESEFSDSGGTSYKQNRYTGSGGNAKIYSTSDKKKTSNFTGSTYKEASSYLSSMGIKDNAAMTESEWNRRRNSYLNTGIGAQEVKRFTSYKAYIQNYVKYRVENG